MKLIFFILVLQILAVRSEDVHCMNRTTKEISVEIGSDNPYRVITFVQKAPGYQVNLQCRWVLKAASNDTPWQMYIQVPVVDFDTGAATGTQCSSSGADVLSLMLKQNQSHFRNVSWCSDSSVNIRREIVNLWDLSYNLTVEFRSDDKQVRSDAKGVQLDVQVLGRDYCHRSMLYLDGSCYLITPEQLDHTEAFRVSRNYLGNVFTVPRGQEVPGFLQRFYQRNTDRQRSGFPYESPLFLAGRKMWTGYSIDLSGDRLSAKFLDPKDNCKISLRRMTVVTNVGSDATQCAVALEWRSDGSPRFTCESMNMRLPALIQFNQIPKTKADMHPQLFRTCDSLPPPPTTTTTATPMTATPTPPHPCPYGCIVAIVFPIVLVIVSGRWGA